MARQLGNSKGPVVGIRAEDPSKAMMADARTWLLFLGLRVSAPVDETAGECVKEQAQETVQRCLNKWSSTPVQSRIFPHPQLLDQYTVKSNAESGSCENRNRRASQQPLCILNARPFRVHHAKKCHHGQDEGDHNHAKHPLRSLNALTVLNGLQVLLFFDESLLAFGLLQAVVQEVGTAVAKVDALRGALARVVRTVPVATTERLPTWVVDCS